MRKVSVEVKVRLIIRQDEGVSTEEVLENMDYFFKSNNGGAEIEDTEIHDWEVTDSNSSERKNG